MKILVIEEKELFRVAARQQLKDHDLTIIDSFEEAIDHIGKQHDFDVVLIDLMMEPSSKMLDFAGAKHLDREIAAGFILAPLAAKTGAKFVGIISATRIYDHPARVALEHFKRDPFFTIAKAKCLFFTERPLIEARADLTTRVASFDEESIQVKDWAGMLSLLIEET
ncbi:response regulator [Candidatus Falkowbacteria bacterium]|jgi:CheY-like chemotaxis protein|nr:response regulator [Candidatus Falkowbacteria bacterium]